MERRPGVVDLDRQLDRTGRTTSRSQQSGKDIFFVTSQGLVPQDTDGVADVYDARLDGGFPAAPAARKNARAMRARAPLTNPAPLLVPGSVSQAPGRELCLRRYPPCAPRRRKRRMKKAAPVKCKRGKMPRHDSCVKRNTKRKKAKKASRDRRTKS